MAKEFNSVAVKPGFFPACCGLAKLQLASRLKFAAYQYPLTSRPKLTTLQCAVSLL